MSKFKSQSDAAPMRFKVDDRVVLVEEKWNLPVGTVCTVKEILGSDSLFASADGGDGFSSYFRNEELDLFEVSYKLPTDAPSKPDGGPAQYYDFPEGAITLNDLIEHKKMDFHRGNIFKACWRWGEKLGTTMEYDARKIIYSGARLLMGLTSAKELRKTLQQMLDDPQFKERDK